MSAKDGRCDCEQPALPNIGGGYCLDCWGTVDRPDARTIEQARIDATTPPWDD